MKNQKEISQIKHLLGEIEERLFDLSPETLATIESTLDFAVYQMEKRDVINAEFITIGEKENV